MYGVIAIISILVRQLCLPNPFECFGDSAFLINWIAGGILAPIAFAIVGQFYESGSAPALGSLLYLLTYAFLTGILWVMGIFAFTWWWVLIVVAALVGLVIGIRALYEKIETSKPGR